MSRRGRRSSYVNLKLSGGGSKKAGLVNSWEWSTIPRSILASNTSVVNYDQTNENIPIITDNLYIWGSISYPVGEILIPILVNYNLLLNKIVGNSSILALTKNGKLYGWGSNSNGQIGDGTTIPSSVPIAIRNDLTFSTIASGYYHSLGIDTDGKLYAWGNNQNGRLGDGTTIQRTSPTLISNVNISTLKKTDGSVSGGFDHTLAIRSDGKLYSWGSNDNGQLGDGTTIQKTSAVPVNSLLSFKYISAGANYSLAITTDGKLYSWGLNDYGQLGDGTTTQRISPVAVNIDQTLTFSMVSAGELYHSLALTTDGKLYAWGANYYGQLGDGTNIQRNSPVPIRHNDLTFSIVSSGIDHSIGITTDGKLYTWGDNQLGQLGNGGTPLQVYTPTQIKPDLTFTTVDACLNGSFGLVSY